MANYILKRLLQLIPLLAGITFLSFALMRLAGGDAVTYLYENAGAAVPEEVIAAARAEYGLDRPFLVQYLSWLSGMVTGDMGVSYVSGQDVFDTMVSKLPATLLLTASSLMTTLLLALPLGILAAVRRGSWVDRLIRFFGKAPEHLLHMAKGSPFHRQCHPFQNFRADPPPEDIPQEFYAKFS